MKTATVRWASGEIMTQKVIRESRTQFVTDDINKCRWYKSDGARVGSRTMGRGMKKRQWESFCRNSLRDRNGDAYAKINGED